MRLLAPRCIAWIPALTWMALIFVASADAESGPRGSRLLAPVIRWLVPDITPKALEQIVLVARKGVHVVTFGILAGLVWLALDRREVSGTDARTLGKAALITLAYAVSDEFHQSLVPPRVGSPWDVAIDMVGAAAMLAVIWRVGQRRRRS